MRPEPRAVRSRGATALRGARVRAGAALSENSMNGSKLFGWIVVLGLVGAGAWFFVPKFRAKVQGGIDSLTEWDDEARRKDPVGYIDFSIGKLQNNIEQFESMRRSLSGAKATLEARKETTSRKLSMGEKIAAELKGAYQTAKSANQWPARAQNRDYTEAELRSQVALTLGEIEGSKGLLAQLEPHLTDLDRHLGDVGTRLAENKGRVELLKAQREMVKATKLTSETEKMLGQIQDVLVQNEAAIAKSPVRTLDEMLKEDARAQAAANPAVDAFLNG